MNITADMAHSSSSSSHIAYCIATDSVYSPNKAIVEAQLAVKDEFQRSLDSRPFCNAFFTTAPPQAGDSSEDRAVSAWYSTGCPKLAAAALKDCELWILFTDGEQEREHEDKYCDTFDLRVAQLQVTQYPCIFVLFGSCAAGPPSTSRYHVYRGTFIECNNAILLFQDIDTDQVFVLDVKGCFDSLKSHGGISEQDEAWAKSKWSTLRRIQYEELLQNNLPLPYPLPLEKQLVVHGGRVLSNQEYSAKMAETDVEDKFDMQRLQEIIKKAAEKDTFSPRYSNPSLPSSSIPRLDIHGRASHAIHMIFMNLDYRSMGLPVPESRLNEYRDDLRLANKANRDDFDQAALKKKQQDLLKQQDNRKSFLLPVPDPEETFYTGFVRAPSTNRHHSEFRGQCMLCYEEDTILVLLMHHADLMNADDHLGHCHVPYMVHSMLVCDACAMHIPSQNNHIERDIVAFLPLVSVIDNEAVWTQAFRKVVGDEVPEDEILILVWKWLGTQMRHVGELEEGIFRDVVAWVLKDLGKWEGATRNRRYDTRSICY